MNNLLLSLFIAFSLLLAACSDSGAPEVELNLSEEQLTSIYQSAEDMPFDALQNDINSMEVAHWLFSQNCASCHQADAKGRVGVPDLTDDFWLFEGTQESIAQTITGGRVGLMPAFSADIGELELGLLVTYVESLSNEDELGSNEIAGQAIYEEFCVVCHAVDGTGLANLGPNLTDDHWQWGNNMITIRQSIANGRNAECPAHGESLSPSQVKLLTAYVLSLGEL